jgi:hypothetical protein
MARLFEKGDLDGLTFTIEGPIDDELRPRRAQHTSTNRLIVEIRLN